MKHISKEHLLCVLAVVISFPSCSSKPTKEKQPVPQQTVEIPAMPTIKETTQAHEPIECKTQEELNNAIATHPLVVVDFHGEKWCAPCRAMHPVIENLAKEMSAVTFVKVNVDNFEPAGIRGVPTFVFYKNGQEVKGKRVVGSQPQGTFKAHVIKVFELEAQQPA